MGRFLPRASILNVRPDTLPPEGLSNQDIERLFDELGIGDEAKRQQVLSTAIHEQSELDDEAPIVEIDLSHRSQ